MLVTSEQMLHNAAQGGYAVGAFNVENAEMIWGVLAAAQELEAPVILQTTPGTLRYLSPGVFAAIVKSFAESCPIPVALHLDHGSSAELAEACLNAGYTSVMIDGSTLAFDENVAMTQRVCQIAASVGIPVEGELGIVGGKEDDHEAEASRYTDPVQAAEFVERTGVLSLAIAVGTAHGYYRENPKLDLEIATKTRRLTTVPLVLHGASGIADETVTQAVASGFSKVNFATELRDTYTRAIRAYLGEHPGAYDPKSYGEPGRQAVKSLVMEKIRACGSVGKARKQ